MSSAVRQFRARAAAAPVIIACLLGAAVGLGGCGGGRVVDPSLTASAAPTGFIEWRDPAAGVELGVPRDWAITPETAPLLVAFSSGPAVISLWRYPVAGGSPPSGPAQLHVALDALEHAAAGVDPTLRIEATATTRLGDAGAVILDAIERVDGQTRRVRSEHVYVPGAEIVLETYAPPARFAGLDHAVFSPVRKSLALLNAGQPGRGGPSTSTTITPTPLGAVPSPRP